MLSRNYKLQQVGNIEWLRDNFEYDSIAYSIDELVVVNVTRGAKETDRFCDTLRELSRRYFMPITAGGGIRCVEDAQKILASGADKIVMNTAFYENVDLVKELVEIYGRQCIVASVDYLSTTNKSEVYIQDATKRIESSVDEWCEKVEALGAGEILLTSIDRDGRGEGYDMEMLKRIEKVVNIPIIANGGCGRFDQFVQVYQDTDIKAAATADLFNFMCDGLQEARKYIKKENCSMAKWDIEKFKILKDGRKDNYE